MATYRSEKPEDGPAIDALVRQGFGPGRYAKTAYRLREGVGFLSELAFVAELDGKLVATVRYWPIDVGGKSALMLGPLAVRNELRGQGIGIGLMEHSLSAARQRGHRAVLLVGDEPYYGRVGFKAVKPFGRITMPGPVDCSRLLGLSLAEGALESLSGHVGRAHLDDPVAAASAPLAVPTKQ
ncbi:MAG: GNAT family N-acetyltransferase [Alphaproteobacteria bacterium]|nr:GNAT family N-acetyltransferase [Alphaproteobacteria bacterium]